MPVTLVSSNAARGRADRMPGRRAIRGPGVFRAAVREALEEGDIRRPSGRTFAAHESHRDHENGGE